MTGKEITEKAARIAYPTLPQEAIERIAVAIWNASPTGELQHVQALYWMMQEFPHRPAYIAECVKTIRNVQQVAAEWAQTI